MNRFIKTFKEISKYKKTDDLFKKIVFFIEDNNYGYFFKKIVDDLLKKKIYLSLITCDKNDFFKDYNSEFIKVFHLENFFLLQFFLSTIKSENFIMTTPDIGNGIINKSPFTKNYVYIFHSLISTNVAYKKNAFKNYDTFFCPTKVHLYELENFFNNKNIKKKFIKIGYPKINELKNFKPTNTEKENKILIAPTWGSNGVINKKEILDLIDKLLEKKFVVIFRPHPMSFNKDKLSITKILTKFQNNSNFILSDEKNNLEVFFNCEHLITDWSGSAIEFSLAFKKPSIFLDTNQRIRNQSIKKNDDILNYTFENICRNEIGIVVKPSEFFQIDVKINELNQKTKYFEHKINNFQNDNIYNVDNSHEVSINEILKLY